MGEFEANDLIAEVRRAPALGVLGYVQSAVGLIVRATMPGAWIGELCQIESRVGARPVYAEVVGFRNDEGLLAPLGDLNEISSNSVVRRLNRSFSVHVGPWLVGRVLDGLGQPIDGRPKGSNLVEKPVSSEPPDPMLRPPIHAPFPTGIRAIDGFLTVGEGQRVGIFAGAGVGKSTLLGMLARNCDADVVVIGLVGERGREVREFLEYDLGAAGVAKAVTVVATSDKPALIRLKAAHVATAIAEYFRDIGARVLLLIDSITRFARALREVGLAAGEPPTRAGFPPSVFSELPRLLERSGRSDRGSITAFYTVLVEGDDHNEPVADETRSILDGHVVLSADRAGRGIFPAIDIARSASRVMNRVVDASHIADARKVRSLFGAYEKDRDLLLMGAYEPGTDPHVDEAVAKIGAIEAFLVQTPTEAEPFTSSRQMLRALARPFDVHQGDVALGERAFGRGDL